MKMFNSIFAAMLALAACQNSQYEDSDTQIDRGTEILVPNGVSLVPKSVNVDAIGRWTITKAPPLDSNTLARAEQLRPIDGRGHFELFYELPFSPSEQAEIRRASPVVTLDMPQRY